jgi:hypothetical protein
MNANFQQSMGAGKNAFLAVDERVQFLPLSLPRARVYCEAFGQLCVHVATRLS